jgi:MFS family permease
MVQSLMPLWGLNATEAGVMASGLAVGYMLAVPFLATLTDRIDARFVLAAGSVLSGIATICFGIFADGLLSATLIWAVAGIGFAGAYMPGLKALTDRLPTGDTSRSVTLYTASFSVGVGLSFLVAQLVAEKFGWRAAFYVTGAGPFLMVLVCIGLAPCKPLPRHGHLLDFAPVLRNRAALGYILGYGAHCFELYGMRTWIVAFWTFVMEQNSGMAPLGAVSVSVIVTLLSLPASVLGNEAALRYGRHRAITIVMLASAVVALVIGFNTRASPLFLLPLVFLYGLTVPADSGALTSGTSASATATHRGATLAAFNCRLWSISPRSMGGRRRARCCWRPSEVIGMARYVRAARLRHSARACRTNVVEHKPAETKAVTRPSW